MSSPRTVVSSPRTADSDARRPGIRHCDCRSRRSEVIEVRRLCRWLRRLGQHLPESATVRGGAMIDAMFFQNFQGGRPWLNPTWLGSCQVRAAGHRRNQAIRLGHGGGWPRFRGTRTINDPIPCHGWIGSSTWRGQEDPGRPSVGRAIEHAIRQPLGVGHSVLKGCQGRWGRFNG